MRQTARRFIVVVALALTGFMTAHATNGGHLAGGTVPGSGPVEQTITLQAGGTLPGGGPLMDTIRSSWQA